ncbi:MAG: GNAT family N-acetyltransferase [Armatimonadetes bacterium]|nr:GNAT family N-acetyltransferase [Armatimonadota bacterium]
MIHIRNMDRRDIPPGLELCRLAGWNQIEADWRRLLALAPGGVFVAEVDGCPCGSASTTAYGMSAAWIGMVLVHPGFRRRGIGSALMAHAVAHLRARRVAAVKLDATEEGRPIYVELGFRDERPVYRCAASAPKWAPTGGARPIAPDDWPAIAARDRTAFGADRMDLLRQLAADGPALALGPVGNPDAYGFARPGFLAPSLGPVVAADEAAARAVIHALGAALPPGPVFWDLLPDNAPARGLAESLGFAVDRRLTRMVLGAETHPGDVSQVYAAAGLELG